MINSRQCPY